MSDLQNLLRDVADRADVTSLADPSSVRRRGAQRSRRTALAVAGAVVAVLVVGGGAWVAHLSPDASISPVGPPSPSPPAVGVPLPGPGEWTADGWDAVTPDWRSSSPVRLEAVAVLHGRYVVVGSGDHSVWWSSDGRAWTPASQQPDSPHVVDVAAYRDEFVAVGSDSGDGSAWWSPDGDHWTAAETAPGHDPRGVSATPSGLFAWGAHTVYVSDAGRTWTPTPRPGPWHDLCWVDPTDHGTTAIGFRATPQGLVPAAWRLDADGWTFFSHSNEAFPCATHREQVHALAVDGGRAVALEIDGAPDRVHVYPALD